MKKICVNKRAYFEYQILDKYVAGMQLQGSEVKSIKNGMCSIAEAYCYISNNEIFIKGMHITQHKEGGKYNNHEEVRDRKLLMKKKEIYKLDESVGKKGLTIVPIEVLVTPTGLIKIEIGLGRGKNLFDKRISLKEKDLKRDNDRNEY
jgi:SsrA-binding protein